MKRTYFCFQMGENQVDAMFDQLATMVPDTLFLANDKTFKNVFDTQNPKAHQIANTPGIQFAVIGRQAYSGESSVFVLYPDMEELDNIERWIADNNLENAIDEMRVFAWPFALDIPGYPWEYCAEIYWYYKYTPQLINTGANDWFGAATKKYPKPILTTIPDYMQKIICGWPNPDGSIHHSTRDDAEADLAHSRKDWKVITPEQFAYCCYDGGMSFKEMKHLADYFVAAQAGKKRGPSNRKSFQYQTHPSAKKHKR